MRTLSPRSRAAITTLLITFGSLGMLPLWQSLVNLWLTDPLRSIGIFIPPLALAGVVSAWRRLHWAHAGSLWGLLLIGLSFPLARLVTVARLEFVVSGHANGLFHPGPVVLLYGAGVTLLFAGPQLLQRASAPLCLLLAVDPVPRFFNAAVDAPLQRLAALTARSFSHLIGLQPTGEQLRMMFAPDFGMLIVPGCDGLRGAVTLAYLTLVFAYTRRLRPAVIALSAVSALFLGYVLNLLRLCLLVIYYRVGLSHPTIQPWGEGVDYVIGCTLFLLAATAFGLALHRLAATSAECHPERSAASAARSRRTCGSGPSSHPTIAIFAFLILALIFMIPQLRSLRPLPAQLSEDELGRSFPLTSGPFHLTRTWFEHGLNGRPTLALADYATNDPIPRHLTFGLWIAGADHHVAFSRYLQGARVQPITRFVVPARNGFPIHLAVSLVDDGVTRTYDAEGACTAESCTGQFATASSGLHFVGPSLLHSALPTREARMPILFEREFPEDTPPELALFQSDVLNFASSLDISSLACRLAPQSY